MATTVDEVASMLEDVGIAYKRADDGVALLTSLPTQHYRSPDGDAGLFLVILVEEDGEYFKVFAPAAMHVVEEHRAVFLQACAMVQFRTKLIQFEWSQEHGLFPIVEFPLEDAPLTARQLVRCVRGITSLIDEYYDALAQVASTGELDIDHLDVPELARLSPDWETLLETFPASVLEAALARVKAKE